MVAIVSKSSTSQSCEIIDFLEASENLEIFNINPFTYGVQFVRYASEDQLFGMGALVAYGCTLVFLVVAIYCYNSQIGFIQRGPLAAAT